MRSLDGARLFAAAKATFLAVLFSCLSVQADETAAPKYKIDAATFKCLHQMTAVNH